VRRALVEQRVSAFSTTVSCAIRWKAWNTKPTDRFRSRDGFVVAERATLRPSNSCSPDVGRSRQPRIDKSVVLPEPLGPMIASFSPARISRLTPASATTCDEPRG
jgi:hypothetical protein